jgi:drug/metabolite transporter (DMT)-like permease
VSDANERSVSLSPRDSDRLGAAPPPQSSRGEVAASHARAGYAMVATAAGLWGTWSLFLRPAERISPLDPALETFLMFATMTVIVAPLALRDRARAPRSRRSWGLMIALGATDALNVLCFFAAMQKGSLAVAVLFHYLAPLLIALSAPFFLAERARFPGVALLVALGGLFLLVGSTGPTRGDVVAGAAWGTASAVFYAATTLLNKRLEVEFTTPELLAYHSAASSLFLLPFLFPLRAVSANALALVVGGAVLLSAGGTILYLNGLRRVPASRAAVLTLIEPVVALFVAVLVWGEPMTARGLIGAALVLAGAYLVLRPSPRAA